MRIMKSLAFALAAAAFGASPAVAIVVIDSDFENDGTINVANNSFAHYMSADGWNAATPPGFPIEIQNNVAGAPHAGGGTNFVELDSTQNAKMTWQNVLGAGAYELSFWYSGRPNRAASDNGIAVYTQTGMVSSLLYGPLAQAGGSSTNWSQYSVSFTAASPFSLSFAAEGDSTSFGGYVDTIMLRAVPEPATWAMMLIGFGAVGYSLRRRSGTQRMPQIV